MDGGPTVFEGVAMLADDEHVWWHIDQRRGAEEMLTGMVHLIPRTRVSAGAPARSGPGALRCGERPLAHPRVRPSTWKNVII